MTVGSGAYSTNIQTVITDPAAPPQTGGSGQATQLVWLQSPTGGTIDSPVSPQPIVAVEDSSGNIVYNDLSSVTLQVNNGPGSLSSNCSGVESYGVIPFGDCSLNAVGMYQLKAVDSIAGVTSALSGTFSISTAPAAQLAFTSIAVSGTASSSATLGKIIVQEQDALGNPTTNAETVTLTSSSAGGVFASMSGGSTSTSLTVTIPARRSTTSFYYGDTVAGSPTITATAPGLAPAYQAETITVVCPPTWS